MRLTALEVIDRRMAEVVRDPAVCWDWPGCLRNNRAYVTINDPDNRRSVSVARAVLERKLGRPIQPGMYACHTCDNSACFNPDHLYEGTPQQNSLDAYDRGRRPVGEHNHLAKLTDTQVREIRTVSTDIATRRVLAEKYGVHQAQIWNIQKRKSHIRL